MNNCEAAVRSHGTESRTSSDQDLATTTGFALTRRRAYYPPGEQNDRVRLMLIRHAEPEANIKGVIGGPRNCTGLTDRGRSQAAALGGRLARDGEHFDVL